MKQRTGMRTSCTKRSIFVLLMVSSRRSHSLCLLLLLTLTSGEVGFQQLAEGLGPCGTIPSQATTTSAIHCEKYQSHARRGALTSTTSKQ
jgi:hypothetical protein